MRGPKPSYPIELTAAESKRLEHLIRASGTPQAQAMRARIILTAAQHPEQSNQQIALASGTTDRTVRKWRRGVFPPQVRAQVTAIACSLPKQCQIPLARWRPAELARRVAQDTTLPHISASTVGRWLKAERLRPWRYHAWQHIHDPVAFLRRARPVLEAYAQALMLLQAGTWLVRLDAKTSIQAREGEYPPRPATPCKPMLHEARYQRRCARHLIAGLSVADGLVSVTCLQRRM